MKKTSLVLLIVYSLVFINTLSVAQTKKIDIAYYELSKPVTISLSNKASLGEWDLDLKNNKGLTILNKRIGYLFTYFTIKITDPTIKEINFSSMSDKKTITRSFTLKPLSSTNPPLKQEIYGDIPSMSRSDGFLSQVNEDNLKNSTEESAQPNFTKDLTPNSNLNTLETPSPSNTMPEPTQHIDPLVGKQYIQSLIDNKLYPQARNILDQLSKQNDVDSTWKDLTDLRLSNLSGNYQDIVDKANQYLISPIPSEDTEITIRVQKAKALEKLGQNNEAEAEFLYIKSYFPKNPEAYSQLADFYIRNQQNEKALKELNYISTRFEGDIQDLDKIYYQLGNAYYKVMGANGYNLALNYYKKVLSFGISSAYYKKSKQLVDFLENNLLNYQ